MKKLLIGILLVIVAFSGYFAWKHSRKDQFADWKTYTNTQYGFSFRYPAQGIYGDTTSDPSFERNQFIVSVTGMKTGATTKHPHTTGFFVLVFPAKDYTKNPVDPSLEHTVSIGGYPATTLGWAFSPYEDSPGGGSYWNTQIFYDITRGAFHYDIYAELDGDKTTFSLQELDADNGVRADKDLVDQILSTFRFTK